MSNTNQTNDKISSILEDPATSYWLANALKTALERDPVDAKRDAEVLLDALPEPFTPPTPQKDREMVRVGSPDRLQPRPTYIWFLATICKCPTSYNDPFRVAIEATSPEHASERLYKLYPLNHAAPDGGPLDQCLCRNPHDWTQHADELQAAAIRHPLSA